MSAPAAIIISKSDGSILLEAFAHSNEYAYSSPAFTSTAAFTTPSAPNNDTLLVSSPLGTLMTSTAASTAPSVAYNETLSATPSPLSHAAVSSTPITTEGILLMVQVAFSVKLQGAKLFGVDHGRFCNRQKVSFAPVLIYFLLAHHFFKLDRVGM